jgi:hypothetical protein
MKKTVTELMKLYGCHQIHVLQSVRSGAVSGDKSTGVFLVDEVEFLDWWTKKQARTCKPPNDVI